MSIAIGGNIGAGKTTLANMLVQKLGYTLAKEPNDENPFLKLFYQDRKRWSFHTQIFFISGRAESMLQYATDESRGFVFDRTILEDRVFARVQLAMGDMTPDEFSTYEKAYAVLTRNIPKPSLYVYLRTTPETCKERIDERRENDPSRADEVEIKMTDLKILSEFYDSFFQTFKMCPLLILDATLPSEELCRLVIECLEKN